MHGSVDDRGKAGVGQAGHRDDGVAGQVAQRFEHLGRPGGAVEADHVDVHGLEGTECGTDLGSRQHGPGQLDGHLDLEGHAPARAPHRPPGPVDGRLGLEEVEDGLDDDEVNAPGDEGGGLLLVGVAKVGVGDLAQGGELGARPMLPATQRGRSGVEKSSAAPRARGGGGQVELPHPVGLPVLGQYRCERPEGVGLDDVASHLEERPVDPVHDVGPGHNQQLVAPLEVRSPEVVGGQAGQLQVGAHGAVEDHHTVGDRLQVGGSGGVLDVHSPSRLPGSSRRGSRGPVRAGERATGRPDRDHRPGSGRLASAP